MKVTVRQLKKLISEARAPSHGANKLLHAVLQDPEHWDLADACVETPSASHVPNYDSEELTLDELAAIEDRDIDWVLARVRAKIVKGRDEAKEMTSGFTGRFGPG